MKKLILGLMLLLSACATSARNPDDRIISTLEVANLTGGFVTVRVLDSGVILGKVLTVHECLPIYESHLMGGSDHKELVFEIGRDDGFVTQPVNFFDNSWAISLSAFPNQRFIDAGTITPAVACDYK